MKELLILAATVMQPADCYEREDYLRMMSAYGEKLHSRGVAGKALENEFELWVNPTTGSWTVAFTDMIKDKDGEYHVRTCTPASGWKFRKDKTGDL